MRKRVVLIGLLVVGVALLSGCELLDQIFGAFAGGGTPGGGTTSPGSVVKASISYNLEATVSEWIMPKPEYAVTTSTETIMAAFQPYNAPTYNATTNTYTVSWNGQTGGEYSDTELVVQLNAAGDTIEYFYARQTQTNVWFAWTYVDEIRGYNVPSSTPPEGAAPGGHYFILKGLNAHAAVDLLTYRRWPPAREGYSLSNPETWVNSHNDIIPSTDNVITIQLDY